MLVLDFQYFLDSACSSMRTNSIQVRTRARAILPNPVQHHDFFSVVLNARIAALHTRSKVHQGFIPFYIYISQDNFENSSSTSPIGTQVDLSTL